MIYDLYDPEPLEALEFLAGPRALRRLVTAMSRDRLRNALHDGHAFLCASRAQRELYTGMLLAEGLLAPRRLRRGPGAANACSRRCRSACPTSRRSPARARGRIRLRGGATRSSSGTAACGRGWTRVTRSAPSRGSRATRPRVRLVFMGASTAPQARAEDGPRLAAELGAPVYFNDAWVPYTGARRLAARRRLRALHPRRPPRDALRLPHPPARLLLGRPAVVCTAGDELGELVAARGPRRGRRAAATWTHWSAALTTVLDRGRGAYADPLARVADRCAGARSRARWSSSRRAPCTPSRSAGAPVLAGLGRWAVCARRGLPHREDGARRGRARRCRRG